MSHHFVWPGFVHVAKAEERFHYYPEGDEYAALSALRIIRAVC
jgi:hypothetical protein